MKLGLTMASVPLTEKAQTAYRAQESGFESAFTDDNPGGDAIVALAGMASAAPRLRIGSGILRAFTRHPVTIASAFANLNAVSSGGVVLGLGTGTKRQNLFQYGLDVPKPVPQLRSVIGMVREYWDCLAEGRQFAWSDEYFQVAVGQSANIRSRQQPRSGQVPVWVAAVNAGMMRLAGRSADGLAGHPCFSSRYLKEAVRPAIDQVRSPEAGPFELAAWAMVVIDEDRERARLRAGRQIAFYLSTKAYQGLLAFYGCSHLYEPLRDLVLTKGDLDAAARLFSTDVIDEIACTGPVEAVAEQLNRYKGVADTVILAPAGILRDEQERRMELDKLMTLPSLLL